ncbi:MAG: hypothetical protein IJ730_04505 [Alphaproteobacteria bacterium]|nr:hypothetical protein [Alphaproteobacteria bacterium]
MIENLLLNIKTAILADENFQSCFVYPEARDVITAPAVFLEVANYTTGNDPATGELSLIANIEARVVVDSISENAELVCQNLACRIASIAHLNSFGCKVSPAKISGISRDAFKPDFDPYICWLVEWSHEFHCGESVWLENGVPPHLLHINRELVNG